MSENENTNEMTLAQFTDEQIRLLDEMDAPKLREVLAGVLKVREIERSMLSRAVATIVDFTKLPPEQVIAALSSGLDKEYQEAADQESQPKLYVPNQGKLQIHRN